ncbi:hypothetical protein C2E23DRAFT_742248 [Lenzites betulinus]|nr:hypothetical protein C2E23DRAFT_742248 [Lenzites betulinus]
MPAAPALDDDVLLNIFSYLHGPLALKVALCSKRFYRLARPRIAAVADCHSPKDLEGLRDFMLSGDPPRATELDDVSISIFTFDYPPEANVSYSDYWDFSQAPLIADILEAAPRVRHIGFERLHPCLDVDERIGPAIAAMTRLRTADFATIGDGTLQRIGPLSASLHTLRLAYFWADDDDLEACGETKTVAGLCAALAPLHNLRALDVWTFDPAREEWAEAAATVARYRFPSLRTLRLISTCPSALDLVECCPGLEHLLFDLDAGLDEAQPLRDGPRWPPIPKLTVTRPIESGCVLHRVGPVSCIESLGDLVVGDEDDGEALENLLALLELTNPLRLSLAVRVAQSGPIAFWERVAAAAPRLQVLELKLTLASLRIEYKHWLDNVPDTLWPLRQLRHLSVVVPHAPTIQPTVPRADAFANPYAATQKYYADARELEEYRAVSLNALPGRLAWALPSLQYISVAAGEINMANVGGSPDEGPPEGIRLPLFLRQGRPHVDRDMVVGYWKVVQDGRGRWAMQMEKREGERMQDFADTTCWSAG